MWSSDVQCKLRTHAANAHQRGTNKIYISTIDSVDRLRDEYLQYECKQFALADLRPQNHSNDECVGNSIGDYLL